ncbi:MAG: hypothetical protein COZ03_02170 [Candidatus Aquicultor secundus]|uniref:Uncharacterized protein n=1 Tax=Candidatus Aquicultor secundus TaxID=1973895 RepID=A0A2M7TA46_9ACTN|nr:MAG: hypothetical protein COZ03_02170 [Candidatus Aquicultor secundus]PIZ40932.1 MAG: hypothetical protein COY37_03120 [Candidatus Aquicultor secundus]
MPDYRVKQLTELFQEEIIDRQSKHAHEKQFIMDKLNKLNNKRTKLLERLLCRGDIPKAP